jgi:hypothetical protein
MHGIINCKDGWFIKIQELYIAIPLDKTHNQSQFQNFSTYA